MGFVVAFVVGYVIGASSGSKDVDRVVQSVRALRRTDEFNDLMAAVRAHASYTLRELASRLDGADEQPVDTEDLVGQVKRLYERS